MVTVVAPMSGAGIGRPWWHDAQRTRVGAPERASTDVGPAVTGLSTMAASSTLIESRKRIILRATRFSRFSSDAKSNLPSRWT